MNTTLSIMLWTTYLISLYFTIFYFIIFLDRRHYFNEVKEKRKLGRYPFVSILIPAYNEEKGIIESIKSVVNLNYPKNKKEIIVINDGSTDKTKDKVLAAIKKFEDSKIILLEQKNQGKAAALNNGLKIAKGEFFACLDADSYVDKDTLMKMFITYENYGRNLAIVTPAMKVKAPKRFWQKIQRLEYLISMFLARLMSHLDCIYVAPGPFSLYRTSVIKRLGGFDVNNLTEDQEIAYRVQKHNYQIKQCYDGYVYTLAPKSLNELYKQRNRWYKGGLFNLLKYRKIILNKEYGDFGLLQLPINFLLFMLSLSTIFFFSYFVIRPIIKNIYNLYLVGFDIKPYLSDLFNIHFSILNMELGRLFILYFLMLLAIAIIFISFRNAKEQLKKRNALLLIPYFFVYYLVLSFIAVIIVFELLIGKIQKW